MAKLIKSPSVFSQLHLLTTTTVFSPAGSIFNAEVETPLSADWVNLRTLITKGSVLFEFPGTDTPPITVSAPSPVLPLAPALADKTKLKVTTLEDNVETQCVIPLPGYIVNHVELNIEAGSSAEIPRGCLLFVFGDNYTVKDTTINSSYSSFQMFAVQSTDITVNAILPCYIVVFRATKK